MVSWTVNYAACDGGCDPLERLTAEQQADFEQAAVDMLWRWTGRRFGTAAATIRPCRQNCGRLPSDGWVPTLLNGQWYNVSCGQCGDSCGCNFGGSVLRFGKRVSSVTSIVIDGATLAASAYRVDDGVLLVRQDGGVWPFCQDMSKPAGQPDTWTITAEFGEPVPVGGQLAAGKLACELAKAASGASNCELPQRWQTISRQGVTITAALDTFEDIDKGHTGIWLIDSWVASVTKASRGFSMASPDLKPAGRQTWTP